MLVKRKEVLRVNKRYTQVIDWHSAAQRQFVAKLGLGCAVQRALEIVIPYDTKV